MPVHSGNSAYVVVDGNVFGTRAAVGIGADLEAVDANRPASGASFLRTRLLQDERRSLSLMASEIMIL